MNNRKKQKKQTSVSAFPKSAALLSKCIDSTSLQEFPSTYAIVLLDMCILNRYQFMLVGPISCMATSWLRRGYVVATSWLRRGYRGLARGHPRSNPGRSRGCCPWLPGPPPPWSSEAELVSRGGVEKE